mmetsp:Transcript_63388/g.163087  ORF Transcript_63388/g.163087 Transcript_63388/m.163087 type:complete len:234 (-) Transcript_63388:64-765(-)
MHEERAPPPKRLAGAGDHRLKELAAAQLPQRRHNEHASVEDHAGKLAIQHGQGGKAGAEGEEEEAHERANAHGQEAELLVLRRIRDPALAGLRLQVAHADGLTLREGLPDKAGHLPLANLDAARDAIGPHSVEDEAHEEPGPRGRIPPCHRSVGTSGAEGGKLIGWDLRGFLLRKHSGLRLGAFGAQELLRVPARVEDGGPDREAEARGHCSEQAEEESVTEVVDEDHGCGLR